MAVVNGSVADITADVTLATSKSKIKDNFDDLLANDVAIEARETALEGGSFVGSARWRDEILPATALGAGASAPDLVTLTGNILAYAFDGGSTAEQLYGSFELNHEYKEGTDIFPHIHWAPVNANAGNVKWNLEYSVASKDSAFAVATTISCTDANLGANTHHVVEFSAISGTGRKVGDVIAFRLYRDPADASDTYASDAILLSLGIHYQVDSTGSVNKFTKT